MCFDSGEKIRKQNGAPANATSSRKARSETTSAPPGSSSVSRSASPQPSSNISGQDGANANNEEPPLDTWDDQADDGLALDADWNEFTFLDGSTLEDDTLFPFPSNIQTHQLPQPTYATRTHPQLSPPNDGSRPCSCGAHAAKALLGKNASRLSQYHALSTLSQLHSPAPLPSMTISETPLSSAPSPSRAINSPERVCNTLTLNTRITRAASEKVYRPKMQRTSTSDSAIELSTSGMYDDKDSDLINSSSRKRTRATTSNNSQAHPSPVEAKQLEVQGSGEGLSQSQQDDNAILQRVSEVLAELVQDDGPSTKRQKRGGHDTLSPGSDEQLSEGNDQGRIASLPKIRRGTLPGGGQIIVIVMQP